MVRHLGRRSGRANQDVVIPVGIKSSSVVEMRHFYVYEHWRSDTGLPFYVGKGKGGRANDLKARNSYHAKIVEKVLRLGFEVEVRFVKTSLDETTAYEFERERIAFWRSQGVAIVNFTNGGEGFSDPTGEIRKKISRSVSLANLGRIVSSETKKKIRESNRKIWSDPERLSSHSERLKSVWKPRPLSTQGRANISAAHKGKVHSHEDRAKRSAKLKGRVFSEEARAKMSAAKKGKRQTPEMVAARSAGLLGHKVSDAARVKISEKAKGRTISEEQRAKISTTLRSRNLAQRSDKSATQDSTSKLD
jgi:hypothetical protein